ncbi:hypothetical protein, partial [Nonomuraea thailandensis]|uniref:hypothetical protein n=1 Tax=Nonomuraea thailandensis TaxID=1188745 RepID=UPI003607ABFE
MITIIVFALAAVCAVEAVLGLVLLGWAVVELATFLRRHPEGLAGGLRDLVTGARRVWPAARASSRSTGRRVLRSRPGRWVLRSRTGRWVLRAGRTSATGAGAVAAGRGRRDALRASRR